MSAESKVSLECDEDYECNISYAYEKTVELYKWYNLKTRFFKKYISTTNLTEELIGSVSLLDPLSIGENILSPINIILPSEQDKAGTGDLITPNPQLDDQQQKNKKLFLQ